MTRQAGCRVLGLVAVCLAFAPDVRAKEYPHIVAALGELKEARRELKEAAHDFGGHRVKALEAVDEAIVQLNKCLEVMGVDPAYVAPSKDVYKRYKNFPHIHHAITELKEARRSLKEAKHDFKGHREKALVAVDAAIDQLEKAVQFKR
jgi:hypothetical protein